MRQSLAAFACGLLFAVGLGVAGMTQPGKVTAFLDFTGRWDPSLLFVMVGAIAVYAIGYRLAVRRPKPLFADAFQIPGKKGLDRRLVVGSALFGIGWGLAGFCPGPALTAIASLRFEPLVFVGAMLLGMLALEAVDSISRSKAPGS